MDGKGKLLKLRSQFEDPVIALQDSDWELPDDVLKAFYATYNLIQVVLGEDLAVFGDSTLYLSINQAADALQSSNTMTLARINDLLLEIKGSR